MNTIERSKSMLISKGGLRNDRTKNAKPQTEEDNV